MSLLFNNSKTFFNLNIEYTVSVKTDASHGVRVSKNSLLKTEYAVSWGKMRRTRVIKRVIFYKIKTQYAASEKHMRRIFCISTIQRQQYAEKCRKKTKTNKNTQKIQKNKTRKNSKYANYTMNAIYLIYNKVRI